MSTQLIIGIIINTIIFGIMGWRNPRTGLTTPKFLHGNLFNISLTIIYFLSFVVILFSQEKLWIKIVIALLMQFVINHIIWGTIVGIITGRAAKKAAKE